MVGSLEAFYAYHDVYQDICNIYGRHFHCVGDAFKLGFFPSPPKSVKYDNYDYKEKSKECIEKIRNIVSTDRSMNLNIFSGTFFSALIVGGVLMHYATAPIAAAVSIGMVAGGVTALAVKSSVLSRAENCLVELAIDFSQLALTHKTQPIDN